MVFVSTLLPLLFAHLIEALTKHRFLCQNTVMKTRIDGGFGNKHLITDYHVHPFAFAARCDTEGYQQLQFQKSQALLV